MKEKKKQPYSHVAPGCEAALIDVAGQVDQLAVVVLQAVSAEGLVHTLAAQGHGQTLVQGQQAQQEDTQQLEADNQQLSSTLSLHLIVANMSTTLPGAVPWLEVWIGLAVAVVFAVSAGLYLCFQLIGMPLAFGLAK